MPKYHSANLTVERLKDECEIFQGHAEDGAKLVHLQGVDVDGDNHFNQATYASVGGDLSKIPSLVFRKVDNSAEAVAAHSDMTGARGYFIFDEALYIEGRVQRVFGYGVIN